MTHPVRARRALTVIFFLQGACFASLLSRIPALQARFGLGEAQLAVLFVVVPVVAGVGSGAAGRLSRRYGSVAVLRAAAPIACGSLAGIGAAGSLPLLSGVLAVFGLALGAVDATMNTQGVAVQDAYQRSLMSGFHAAYSLAGILGSLAAAAAATAHLPLAVFLGAVAALGVAGSVAVGPAVRLAAPATDANPAAPVPVQNRTAVVPWRPIVVIGFAVTCLFIADSATANWSAVYLRSALYGSESVAALGYGTYAAAMLLGRTVGDVVADRLGAVLMVRLGGSIAAAGLGVVVAAGQPLLGLAGFWLLGLGLAAVVPLSFTAAARTDPASPAAAVARVNVFTYVGFVLGAPIVGLVAHVSSLRLGFLVPLLLVLAIVAVAPSFDPQPADGNGTGSVRRQPR